MFSYSRMFIEQKFIIQIEAFTNKLFTLQFSNKIRVSQDQISKLQFILHLIQQKDMYSEKSGISTRSTMSSLSNVGAYIPRKKKGKKDKGETIYRYGWIHRLIYRTEVYRVNGVESQSFNRRTYQIPIQELKYVNRENLGFTNQILCKLQKKKIQLYIPVYINMKIKSIQQISLGQLLARVGCVLLIFIYIKGLPEELIQHLSENVLVQINRGESFLLASTPESGKIALKRDKQFLTFTIRDTFPVQIYEDVFLSPFEILNLVFSVTFNSTTKKLPRQPEMEVSSPHLLRKTASSIDEIEYTVSFNCMRQPLEIPMTYASECRLGVYDLAEQLLEHYSTNKASYNELIDNFEDFLDKKEEMKKKDKNQDKKTEKKKPKSLNSQLVRNKIPHNFAPPQERKTEPLVMMHSSTKQSKEKKIHYFQYTHFVIPLYKFPGNAWATIFIPMFMLALLSIFIFLQTKTSIEQKLGSIATFVLGFISIVPNIKNELPPSQKISFSQVIVYVESVNCMLSLFQQFSGISKKKVNPWNNPLFVFSIVLHFICFSSSLILLFLHYFVWQPRYNIKEEPPLSSPKIDFLSWNNPYCDQVFLEYNQKQRKNKEFENQAFPWPLSNFEKLTDTVQEHL